MGYEIEKSTKISRKIDKYLKENTGLSDEFKEKWFDESGDWKITNVTGLKLNPELQLLLNMFCFEFDVNKSTALRGLLTIAFDNSLQRLRESMFSNDNECEELNLNGMEDTND
ncbi:MAG: hypothetical protein SWH68_01745 [Thermodesulfobacteriota bacterium]|nr:hypothetical protein [Thermodesulfobacteriota bacterium]